MNARRFAILFVLALATIAFAFWLSTQRYLPRDADFGARVLDGLEADLNAIDRVRIVGAGDRALVTLARTDGRWRVAEIGYPADAVRVKRLLIALAELRVLEPKTSDPGNYAALGVDDVKAATASGVRVELGGAARAYALLVGRPSPGSQSRYVRIPGEARSLEARPALDIERDPKQWLARTILDVPVARLQSVEVVRTDGPAWSASKASRAAPFVLAAASADTAGSEAAARAPGAVDGAASALANVEFVDVRPVDTGAPPPAPRAPHVATLRTFDGLVVTMRGYADGERRWLELDARFDRELAARFPPAAADGAPAPGAEQVAAEAERLATTARGWRYEIPAWKFDTLFRPRAEIAGAR